jgi:hypothetical protein
MPRKRNPVGIAAGKLILAIRSERNESAAAPDAALARKVLDRAHTLLQATESSSVLSLLDGRSVVEYLGPAWVEMHPSVKPSIDEFIAVLCAHEGG